MSLFTFYFINIQLYMKKRKKQNKESSLKAEKSKEYEVIDQNLQTCSFKDDFGVQYKAKKLDGNSEITGTEFNLLVLFFQKFILESSFIFKTFQFVFQFQKEKHVC